MAKLLIAVWSVIDFTSVIHVFHLVITFHCRVTMIFVKVGFVTPPKVELSKMDVKNEQSAIKF